MARNNQTSPNGNGNVATLEPPIVDEPSTDNADNAVDEPSTDVDEPSVDEIPAGLPTFTPASMTAEYPERMAKLDMKQCRDFPEYAAMRSYPSHARRVVSDAILAGAIRTKNGETYANVTGTTKPYATDQPYWFSWLARGAEQFAGVGNPRIVRAAAAVIADELKNHPVDKVGTAAKPVNGGKSSAVVVSPFATITDIDATHVAIRIVLERGNDEENAGRTAQTLTYAERYLDEAPGRAAHAALVAQRNDAIVSINKLPMTDEAKATMIAMIPDVPAFVSKLPFVQ